MLNNLPLYSQINVCLLILGVVFCIVPEVVHGLYSWIHRREPKLPPIPGATAPFPTCGDISWTLLFIVLLARASNVNGGTGGGEESGYSVSSLLLFSAIEVALYLPMVLRLAFVTRRESAQGVGFHLISPGRLIKGGFLYVILAPFIVSIMMSTLRLPELLHEWTLTPIRQDIVNVFQTSESIELRICIACLAIIIAPLVEECCFRGFLYNALKKRAGMAAAVLISSFFFAALHTSLVQFLPLFVFAVFQCHLYEKTRTITAPIIAHAVFNTLGVLTSLFFPDL